MSDFFEENFQRAVFAPVIKITKNTKKPVFVRDISDDKTPCTEAVREETDCDEEEIRDNKSESESRCDAKEQTCGKSVLEVSGVGFFENSLRRLVTLAENMGFEISLEREENENQTVFYAISVKKKNTRNKS